MIVMLRRKPGLSPEEFRKGYEESHSRIAVRLFGHLWLAYRRNYLSMGRKFLDNKGMAGQRDTDELGFDAISEYILKDEAAYAEMGRIAAANYDLIKDDEALWFDQQHCWTVACETVEEDLTASAAG
jgi:hypothetical protein